MCITFLNHITNSKKYGKNERNNSLPLGPKNFTQNSLSPPRIVTSCLLSILQQKRKQSFTNSPNPKCQCTHSFMTSVSIRRFPALGDDILSLLSFAFSHKSPEAPEVVIPSLCAFVFVVPLSLASSQITQTNTHTNVIFTINLIKNTSVFLIALFGGTACRIVDEYIRVECYNDDDDTRLSCLVLQRKTNLLACSTKNIEKKTKNTMNLLAASIYRILCEWTSERRVVAGSLLLFCVVYGARERV